MWIICLAENTVMRHLFWVSPQGYKTFFTLNLSEHETFSVNKYENANNSWHFYIH